MHEPRTSDSFDKLNSSTQLLYVIVLANKMNNIWWLNWSFDTSTQKQPIKHNTFDTINCATMCGSLYFLVCRRNSVLFRILGFRFTGTQRQCLQRKFSTQFTSVGLSIGAYVNMHTMHSPNFSTQFQCRPADIRY